MLGIPKGGIHNAKKKNCKNVVYLLIGCEAALPVTEQDIICAKSRNRILVSLALMMDYTVPQGRLDTRVFSLENKKKIELKLFPTRL